MLLGLAYAATIGGMATLIGTPPNALLAAFVSDNYAIEISFIDWMMVGVPVSCVLLPSAWWLLTRKVFRVDVPASAAAQDHLTRLYREMGAMTAAEKRVATVFYWWCWGGYCAGHWRPSYRSMACPTPVSP